MQKAMNLSLIIGALLLTSAPWCLAADDVLVSDKDILIADFESEDYGDWEVEGDSFGPGPAEGTLPNQMNVTGYYGERLVNSFHGGDGPTGTLTSPPFTIERTFINFLIGGGGWPDHTGMHLIVDGEVVRKAAGPNTKPGGSETLRWKAWDVSEFAGKRARIQIVDKRTKGWGHINVDHIMQSNERFVSEQKREITVSKRYLNMPVKTDDPKTWMRLMRGDTILREFDIELAEGKPDFWVTLDLAEFQGETLTLWAEQVPRGSFGFETTALADVIIGGENLYKEEYRPQFHFSPMRGWNNDPNGMVYYKGEYHLFFQHNPYGWNWGNMTWGHAVSKDLVHWEEIGDAIHPDELGTIFSGSAVVDEHNTTGFQTGDEKPLVCIYTYAGGRNPWSKDAVFTQALAYSNDRGRTWTKYEGNPVQGHINGSNRDPKVIWHEPTNQWAIVLYLDDDRMAFFTSKDLKQWDLQSELTCFHECPELFELPVDGDASKMKWVLYGAAGDYYVGEFDGKEFKPDGDAIKFQYGNCFYASQTFNNVPAEDGRRIQIAWGRAGHKTMPFNQMMDFPVELTLHTTDEGVRMFAEPVKEIELLHAKQHTWQDLSVKDKHVLDGPTGDLFDIRVEFGDVSKAKEVGLTIRGATITYDVEKGELRCKDKTATVKPIDGKLILQILVDRLSIEIFANNGRVYMPMTHTFEADDAGLEVLAADGECTVNRLEVFELESIWQ